MCNYGWDNNDARVVCRQLGYMGEGDFIHCEKIVDIAYVTCVPMDCRVIFAVQFSVAILFKNDYCSVMILQYAGP